MLLVGPGTEVYEGMVVGENARDEEMDVNPTKEKKLTNIRSSTADELERLTPPLNLSLEQALEFIADDECVEVTPKTVRLRKVVLDQQVRGRQRSRARTARACPRAARRGPLTCCFWSSDRCPGSVGPGAKAGVGQLVLNRRCRAGASELRAGPGVSPARILHARRWR